MTGESINAVVIGRNEGERLRHCLKSIIGKVQYVVYVDSGSTDGSSQLAEFMGAVVVNLDMKMSFTAAMGRNAGFERLMEIAPETKFVQFVDGDCELVVDWLETAKGYLEARKEYAVVCGRLQERHPETSLYNRLLDIEWSGSIGEIQSCGGIFMIRAKIFKETGGMDSTIIAGEEPEMCSRLRKAGWLIYRLNQQMAWHDANLITFREWWRRAVRSGYGSIDVFERTNGNVFSSQVKRVRLWTLGWLSTLLVVSGFGIALGSHFFIWSAIVVTSLYPLQIVRISIRFRQRLGWRESLIYGCLMMVSKWAELYGQLSRSSFRKRQK